MIDLSMSNNGHPQQQQQQQNGYQPATSPIPPARTPPRPSPTPGSDVGAQRTGGGGHNLRVVIPPSRGGSEAAVSVEMKLYELCSRIPAKQFG